jgi:hypothetical protein
MLCQQASLIGREDFRPYIRELRASIVIFSISARLQSESADECVDCRNA